MLKLIYFSSEKQAEKILEGKKEIRHKMENKIF